LQFLGLRFEHRSISVFRGFAGFQAINPVVKAPTLVCDDGEVLMDSSLILEYAETLAQPRTLLPREPRALQHALRIVGLALAACEKSVQIIYERTLRPLEKQYEPWLTRVEGQLLAACTALESEVGRRDRSTEAHFHADQAMISAAVAWHFIERMVPDLVPIADYPSLSALSADAERLPEFAAAPHGDGTYRG
jgi:glutathione S-transferase